MTARMAHNLLPIAHNLLLLVHNVLLIALQAHPIYSPLSEDFHPRRPRRSDSALEQLDSQGCGSELKVAAVTAFFAALVGLAPALFTYCPKAEAQI